MWNSRRFGQSASCKQANPSFVMKLQSDYEGGTYIESLEIGPVAFAEDLADLDSDVVGADGESSEI